MRLFTTHSPFKLAVLLWAALWSLGLLLAFPGNGEARTKLAEPTPTAQAGSSRIAAPPADIAAFPKVLARRAFGAADDTLLDLQFDASVQLIYLSDASGNLHVLDATTLDTIAELPVTGVLTLDSEHDRLYVAPGEAYWQDEEITQVSVIDTQSLEVIGVIPDARMVTLDSAHGRIFAGNPLRMTEPQDRGVRAYAADSLDLLAESDLTGIPVYNPMSDELIIVEYTALVVDPDTLAVQRDLLPELAEQPFRWCNGCERASSVSVHPDHGIVAVQMTETTTGGGPGFLPAPRFFDARSMAELTDGPTLPAIQPTCGSQPLLLWPEGDRRFMQEAYYRYIAYRNLLVTDTGGAELAWRDGLSLPFIHPQLGYGVTDTGYVFDLVGLVPTGLTPAFCTMAYDTDDGRIFGASGNELIAFADSGGESLAPAPTEAEPLPDTEITGIIVSPDYATDQTLFVLIENRMLYKSQDGGQNWSRVQGGLPEPDGLMLDVAISPAYATDRTLFSGGFTGGAQGHGVLRSTDGGDTWQPFWDGLPFLRVYRVAMSPGYATDGVVLAYSYYTRLSPWESGVALERSTDRGLTWSTVMTATYESELPAADELLLADSAALPVRLAEYGRRLELSDDGGATWQSVDLKKSDDNYLISVMTSPDYAEDSTLYVLGDWAIWRSQDDGQSWSRWTTPQLAEEDFDYRLTALAITPKLEDGSHRLLVGTSTGDLLTLTPAGSRSGLTVRRNGTESAAPRVTPSATVTSPLSTAAPATTSTPEPLTGEPPTGLYRPQGALATLWEAEPRTQQELGWATVQNSIAIDAAVQQFERGLMIWRGDTHAIYALYDDHAWEVFIDQFREGEPESDPTLEPPQGLLQPIRGFGKLWRTNAELRDKLGWALAEEQGYQGYVHPFERGLLLGSGTGILVLANDVDGRQAWR